ncbi:MAG: hypothetical protein CVU56_26180 [Deltaproteobacteria bacterium HGW-Deltaproteobacteria-14]|jgi:hypothetical protein|nr:MAG: hypothetical protein CVU56_26180 [Deltaproteobacteria bacterium HGW-Deltaproteobacteria-14]
MASLKDLAETVHAALRRELDTDVAAARLGVDPARLGIYRGFVHDHVSGILDKLYPYVRAHLGSQIWAELVAAYFREVPARHWELNACGEAFPAWLDARIAAGDGPGVDPFHVALAELEWEQFVVYMHAATVPAGEHLEAPVLNPTLSLLDLAYPVVRFIVDHPEVGDVGPAIPVPAAARRLALLFRRPGTWRVAYYQGSDDLLFALKVVHEQIPLAVAAEAVHQPIAVARAAVDHAIAVGLVLAPPDFAAW